MEKSLTTDNVFKTVVRFSISYFLGMVVLRKAIVDGAQYEDDILMAILEDEWRTLKQMAAAPHVQ
ncbi:hypothetical protein AAK899_12335 [Erysipelotrichaceae bacterium 51-3]